MKITAQDLSQLGVIDSIITEPVGGAHRDRPSIIKLTGTMIEKALREFDGMPGEEVRRARQEKFLAMGRGL